MGALLIALGFSWDLACFCEEFVPAGLAGRRACPALWTKVPPIVRDALPLLGSHEDLNLAKTGASPISQLLKQW